MKIITTALLLCCLNMGFAWGQQQRNEDIVTRILFLFDGSNSMNGKWETGKKIDVARKLLSEMVDSLESFPNVRMAMRIYGHQYKFPPPICTDTKLEVPFAMKNADRIRKKLHEMTPQGTTPIAYSLKQVENDFPPCPHCRDIVILITDGIEACDGDPCAISLMLQRKGIFLKPFIIGIGDAVELRNAFECMGQFFDAASEESFQNVLDVIVSQLLRSTTVQVKLYDDFGLPSETNIAMSFFDRNQQKNKYNFIHTMDASGNPDTLILDHAASYDLTVHSLPPVGLKNIKLKAGDHNVIKLNAPQGFLVVEEATGHGHQGINCIVRQAGSMRTLNVQPFYGEGKYITGKYDLEILTLPRTFKYDVEVTQSQTAKIVVPQPGVVNFSFRDFGFASLYLKSAQQLKWVYNLDQIQKESLTLQPGKYLLVYRGQDMKKTTETKTQEFVVRSGYSQNIKF